MTLIRCDCQLDIGREERMIEPKVTENLGVIGQEIYKTISRFGKDTFAVGGLPIKKLVEYLGGYVRSSIE